MTIFGYKLHLLLALNGTILDFELAPANVTDLEVGEEMLSAYTDLDAVGDKAYISQPVREDLGRARPRDLGHEHHAGADLLDAVRIHARFHR